MMRNANMWSVYLLMWLTGLHKMVCDICTFAVLISVSCPLFVLNLFMKG